MRTILSLVGVGWYVAVAIFGGVAGGYWLDGQFSSSPLFTLLGLGLGIAVALFGMYRMLMSIMSSDTNGAGPAG